jgi:uncharacterized membrane protein YedE/YeeE
MQNEFTSAEMLGNIRDEQVIKIDAASTKHTIEKPLFHYTRYAILGVLFGIVFVKAEIISWFRIQEMFRLQSFHMYGVIGSAIVVGMISIWLLKKFKVKTVDGAPISIEPKKLDKGHIYGGLIFGAGWALTGACPGPLYALIGTGALAIIVTLLSAIAGAWVYGYFADKLPY